MANGHRGAVVESVRDLMEHGTAAATGEAQLLERFRSRSDEVAFEALVRRHGPMVLGVCRRVLADPSDADDAFQATFLVLVKNAGAIRNPEILGAWLHGVARRVAVRARVDARRRRACERAAAGVGGRSSAAGADAIESEELRTIVDDELAQLPARYRVPMILCDLQGWTHDQAAAELRCPVGTVKSRLSRGREKLRVQLVRRGLAPTAAGVASTLASGTASAVPAELLSPTVAAATQLAAGRAIAAGVVSARVLGLMRGVVRSMMLSKSKYVAAAALAAVLTTTGVWVLMRPAPAQTGAATDATPKGASPRAVAQVRPTPATAAPKERGVERFQLDNGLKVILRPIAEARKTDLVVVYAVGNDHDPKGRSGLGHMVEHLYATAAAGDTKARTVEELARRYPNGSNAQTGARYTVISTAFAPSDLNQELRDAAARMSDLRITANDLARERERLRMEVENMFSGYPALAALNNARELIRPALHGGRTGGRTDHVEAITTADVQAHWTRYYKPRNAIVALAGAFDPAEARKAVTAHFGKLAPGDPAPAAGEPPAPRFGARSDVPLHPNLADAGPMVCLAYLAPKPGTDLYAPFLVLLLRLWSNAQKLGEGGVAGAPVYFTPLDDGTVVAVSSAPKAGETSAKAITRMEAFIRDAIGPELGKREGATAREELSFLLGTADIPDAMLAQNPYGVAFGLARRDQLQLDAAKLGRALETLTDRDLRRAADEIFAPGRHATAVVEARK